MAVKNAKALAEAISNWIKEQAEEAHATNVVFGLSGGVDSALVALLCKMVFPNAVGVNMPCHSSGSARDRAVELADKIGLTVITVDLSVAHDHISRLVETHLENRKVPFEHSNGTEGALRSCLRAPTLDYLAKKLNAIIVGTGNRDEDTYTRYFQKRGDGCVDISPIASLHKSEVYQLATYLGCTTAILSATPTADLWGPNSGQTDEGQLGITYHEVEWGIRQSEQHGLRVCCDLADLEPDGEVGEKISHYSDREQQVLTTLLKMEFISRHKENPNLPVFDARAVPGLVE